MYRAEFIAATFDASRGMCMLDKAFSGFTLTQLTTEIQCISQELILLRIALGRAWSRKTTLQVSEVVFRNSALRSTATHNMGRTRGSQQLNTVMPSGDDVVSGTMLERSQDTTQTPVR